MSFGTYILTVAMILTIVWIVAYLRRTFYNHGSIEIESREDRDIWKLHFTIPEEKIVRKKYILLRIDVRNGGKSNIDEINNARHHDH